MSQGVEIAAAYVTVIPSFKGFNKAMTKEITAALGGSAVGNEAAKMGAKVGAAVGRETSKSFRQAGGDLVQSINAPLSKVGGVFARSVAMSAGAIARPLGKVAGDAGSYFATTAAAGAGKIGSAIGRSVSTAMTTAVQATLATASAGAAAIGGQVIGGGAKRAVSMNSAEAKLKALGYQGKAFEAIMASATESVDGTAYTMADAVGSSAQMLAAGIKPGKELTGILKNVGKVSDISGRSFNEMGTMLSKMASAGTIYAEDLNQLAESGIPIYAEMAKTMGVSAVEVKKLASEGKIAFSDLDKTIGAIKWDSALFAATDIKSAFNNLRSAMSKIGQKFWDPVIDGAVPMINNMKNTINALTKIIDFTPMEKKIEGFMKRMNGVFKPFQDAAGAINPKKIEAKFDEVVAKFKDFRQSIAGMEGPLVGLVAGIFGKMLSGVPLIGPMFAGIGPGVGIMIGAFAGAVTHSKALQKQLSATVTWIKDLGKSFRTKFTGLEDSLGSAKDVMKKIGDTFAIGLAAVRNIIDRVVSKIDFSPFIAKFETMMSNLKGFTGDVMDDAGNIDMSKLDAAIDSLSLIHI